MFIRDFIAKLFKKQIDTNIKPFYVTKIQEGYYNRFIINDVEYYIEKNTITYDEINLHIYNGKIYENEIIAWVSYDDSFNILKPDESISAETCYRIEITCSTINENDIKPCPFCGHKARFRFYLDMKRWLSFHIIKCEHCGAKIKRGIKSYNEYKDVDWCLIEAWNNRVN